MPTIGIGTEKGAWLLRSDDGGAWAVEGPVLPGWRVTTFGRTPSGRYLLGAASNWFGPSIHVSDDLTSWEQVVDGPSWPEEGGRKLKNVWTITTAAPVVYAGVDDAGLFRSDDDGTTWRGVDGFNDHETRPGWVPGAGGLAAHRLLVDPQHHERMWLAVSAVGVFRTEDGGVSWVLRNEGVEKTAASDDYPDIGYCVHRIVADTTVADRIWRQDHKGVYRTLDGGDHWERIESGLPAGFGFPIVRDAASGSLFVVPQESDQHRLPVGGEFRVYRSTDDGDSWQVSGTGHPTGRNYAGVLRDAMDTDGAGGVYLGTTAGAIHVSRDGGDTWRVLDHVFPRVDSLAILGP
jgi:photosystem II stability/assembly factor-like uncharacterized protein